VVPASGDGPPRRAKQTIPDHSAIGIGSPSVNVATETSPLMAIIHTFLSLKTDGAGGTLTVRGESVDGDGKHVDLGEDAEIFVAVIRAGHLTNRADLKVEDPGTNPWSASTGSHHFNRDDEVYAVGAATQKPGDRPRLFADQFTITHE
jgi:hypothetical protein